MTPDFVPRPLLRLPPVFLLFVAGACLEAGPRPAARAVRGYLLELKHSDRRGALEDDGLVVTPEPGTR